MTFFLACGRFIEKRFATDDNNKFIVKKYASKTLRLIALLYCSLPVVYPIWLSFWFDLASSRVISLFLSLGYWLVIILAVASGVGLWEVKRWSWYVFLAANLLLIYETAFVVATYGDAQAYGVQFLAGVALVFAIVVRVGKELRVPYFLPNIRWWESDPARKLLIPTKLGFKEVPGDPVEGEIMDIAMGGCFVKCPHDFAQDAQLDLSFWLFGHEIHCSGNIVWRAASAVTHPKGIGVKFEPLGKVHRRRLRAATRRLRDLSVFTPVVLNQPILKERAAENAKA
jgi:hypothetical protein